MKITQEVREYAAARGLEAAEALAAGMHEQSEAFEQGGGALYHPDGP
jgi:phosphomethylpyrimidine synthase